jgi:hypothetical protein
MLDGKLYIWSRFLFNDRNNRGSSYCLTNFKGVCFSDVIDFINFILIFFREYFGFFLNLMTNVSVVFFLNIRIADVLIFFIFSNALKVFNSQRWSFWIIFNQARNFSFNRASLSLSIRKILTAFKRKTGKFASVLFSLWELWLKELRFFVFDLFFQ